MNSKTFKTLACALVSLSLLSSNFAYAKRFGGGKSAGRQNTTAIQNANNPQQAPQQNQQQNFQQQPSQSQQNMPQTPKPSLGIGKILGGVAAGLGLAYLASKLGLGAAFGNILMIVAIFMLGMFLFSMFRRKKAANASSGYTNNYATASGTNGVGTGSSNINQGFQTYDSNLNNSANTSNSTAGNTGFGGASSYQNNNQNFNSQPTNNSYPAEINQLIATANDWFMNIQQLSDSRNLTELQNILSPELFSALKADFESSALFSKTVTQNLVANLLDWRETQYEFLATIQYKANVSEDGGQFNPINEAWTFTKDKTLGVNAKWKLDGISQLNSI